MNDDLKAKLHTARLVIVDQDNSFNQVQASGIATEFIASGFAKKPINFDDANLSLQELKERGYLYVSSNLPDDATFNADEDQSYQMIVRHQVHNINSDNPDPIHGFGYEKLTKMVKRTVTYLVDNGVELVPVIQKAYFDASGILDEVTGKLVSLKDGKVDPQKHGELVWNGPQELPQIDAIAGYNLLKCDSINEDRSDILEDGTVKAIVVNHESQDIELTITLTAKKDQAPKKSKATNVNAQEDSLAAIGLTGIKK